MTIKEIDPYIATLHLWHHEWAHGVSARAFTFISLSASFIQVLCWMEQCAYISASRLRASHVLTAALDSVSFSCPTRVGDILYITSQVRRKRVRVRVGVKD